jgi:hypothetical protein
MLPLVSPTQQTLNSSSIPAFSVSPASRSSQPTASRVEWLKRSCDSGGLQQPDAEGYGNISATLDPAPADCGVRAKSSLSSTRCDDSRVWRCAAPLATAHEGPIETDKWVIETDTWEAGRSLRRKTENRLEFWKLAKLNQNRCVSTVFRGSRGNTGYTDACEWKLFRRNCCGRCCSPSASRRTPHFRTCCSWFDRLSPRTSCWDATRVGVVLIRASVPVLPWPCS